jgi:serine/threonine protein kinase
MDRSDPLLEGRDQPEEYMGYADSMQPDYEVNRPNDPFIEETEFENGGEFQFNEQRWNQPMPSPIKMRGDEAEENYDNLHQEDQLVNQGSAIMQIDANFDNITGEQFFIDSTSMFGQPSSKTFTYTAKGVLSKGNFGSVYKALVQESGQLVAIKKVFEDPDYKTRELEILKKTKHPNVVKVRHAFYTREPSTDKLFLNLVMDYIPDTLHKIIQLYKNMRQNFPLVYAKLYTYQLLRALGYLHAMNICHRDVKPQNLLVDLKTHAAKLCDFGSAKRLERNETSISYIVSRNYRAPELIFGSTRYGCSVDMWSAGCVLAEIFLGAPLFNSHTSKDHIKYIIRHIGTPTKHEMDSMNPYNETYSFPYVKVLPLSKLLHNKAPPDAIDFISKLLVYDPRRRLTAHQAMMHPFFDTLRNQIVRMPRVETLPELFNFNQVEMSSMSPETLDKLKPDWYENLS